MDPFDLVVRGGDVADGLGGPLRRADVAIRAGKVAAVGEVSQRGREEIDATGRLVTPGFVDIHTHYDAQAVWDSQLAPSSWHGVTTAVMGNCGVGFAPVRAEHRQTLIDLMEGVEDIPGAALHEGLDFRWETFDDYLGVLESRKRDIDLAAQLPHGPLRVYAMGERAARLEPATAADIDQMRGLAADAIRSGAVGFSTTRSLNHRTVRGDPTPSLRASSDELMGIAMGLKDANAGVLQFISDFDTPSLEVEFAMLRGLVEASGRPLSISIAQRHTAPDVWKRLLDLIGEAANDGLPMRGQVAPRPVGVLLGLQGSRNPFSFCPTYEEISHLPLAERVARMAEPMVRAALIEEADAPVRGFAKRMRAFERMYPFGSPPEYEPAADSAIAVQAERQGKRPAEIAYDLVMADEGRAFIYAPFANYAAENLDVCHAMMSDPNTVIGLGDGGAHVSVISDGSFPTYLLAHWGRDRAHGRFDLGWLVKRHTSDTARAVGLTDRGVLAPGMKGDLNVIDMERLSLDPPRMIEDLPACGRRLLQKAHGYDATVVSGEIIYRHGEATGALPGKLVRGANI